MQASLSCHVGWSVVAVVAFSIGYLAGAPSVGKTVPSSSAAPPVVLQSGTAGDASGTRDKSVDKPDTADNSSGWESPRGSVVERAAQAMLMGSDLRRQRVFLALLDEMQPSDAPAIRSVLAKSLQQGVLYENLWEQFWMRWGELDGAGAMDFILKTQKHGAVEKEIGRVMWGWGAAHPQEAAQWLEAHQGLEYLGKALIGLTHGFASENLPAATSMALRATSSGDPLLGKLTEALSEQAVRQGREAGLTAWFDRLPAGGEPGSPRAAALGHVYWRLWSADPEKAMDWVGQQATKPWRSDLIIGELAGRVAEKDPAKALTWLQNIPPSQKDNSYPGVEKIVRTWSAKSPDVAAHWIDALPSGAFKDQANAAFSASRNSLQQQTR